MEQMPDAAYPACRTLVCIVYHVHRRPPLACQHSTLVIVRNPSGVNCRGQTKKKKPPQYRVMLHNDSFNRREYVVKILLKVVDVITMADAVNIMQARFCCQGRLGRCSVASPRQRQCQKRRYSECLNGDAATMPDQSHAGLEALAGSSSSVLQEDVILASVRAGS